MESSAAKQQSMAGANVITAEQKYLRTELEQRRVFTRLCIRLALTLLFPNC